MRKRSVAAIFLPLGLLLALTGVVFSASKPLADNSKSAAKPAVWDAQGQAAAAKYLDQREVWWQEWPHAQKDHGTVCVSCHTQVPYALVRPMLRYPLDENGVSAPERAMIDSVLTRVKLGKDAKPFYNDADNGEGKTVEATNTESVFNALILASYDAKTGHLSAPTRDAFKAMWANQQQTGPKAGAWVWQNFHYSPWEGDDSEYFGAVMAAVAAAIAPDNYRSDPDALANLVLLRGYLTREAPKQPIENRMLLLWASGKYPGMLTHKEQDAITREIFDQQQSDGGWSLETLGTFKRRDDSKPVIRSDGYATGLAVLALEESGAGKGTSSLRRGLAWLIANQDRATGRWPGWSVNKNRDPESDIGKFMSDSGTAFAVMALEKSK